MGGKPYCCVERKAPGSGRLSFIAPPYGAPHLRSEFRDGLSFFFPAARRARLLRYRCQLFDRGRHHAHARRVLRPARVAVHLPRECGERRATCGTAPLLRRVECGRDRGGAIGGEAAVADELVEVRAYHGERCWPDELRLALRVVLPQRHQLCRGNLVLGELRAWRQLEDVEPSVEFR